MAKSNVWLHLSDLMTGLMIIFLFIAISYISKVKQNQTVLTDYVYTKNKLHQKLVKEFQGDTLRWQMSIGKDLSMKFNNPTVFFASGQDALTQDFKKVLDEFLPRYFDILLRDSLRKDIIEIRIEGHTDDVPAPIYDSDPYVANVILSQRRAVNVMRYFRKMEHFQNYSEEDKRQLEYWFTANGLSYGKSIDFNGNYANITGLPINRDVSRRVEFMIVTSGDSVLENFVKNNSKK